MVERIMRNPEATQITESEVIPPRLEPRGPCLVCGEWIDEGQADDPFTVTLDRRGEVFERVAHASCIAAVAHESAGLGGVQEVMPDVVPDNYLASKFRTPSGR